MITITQNELKYLTAEVLSPLGKPVTGLIIDYEIHKCSDNSLLTSGTASEIGTTGVYMFSYTFTTIAEYTLHWISPTNYEDGFEDLSVIAPEIVVNDIWAELTAALVTPNSIGKLLVDNIDAPISGISSLTIPDVETALKNYDSAKQATVKQDITNSQDIIIKEINKTAAPVVVPQEKQRPYNWET